jgi:hypothetical protein
MSRLLRRSALLGLSAVLGFFALAPGAAHAAAPAKPESGKVSLGMKVPVPTDTIESLQASGKHGIVKIDTKATSFTAYNSGIIISDGVLFCPYPWLDTAYGPLAQCSVTDGFQAVVGFYSPLTDAFNASGDPLTLAGDGFACFEGPLTGCFIVQSAYGDVSYLTEYQDNPVYGPIARWGNWNYDANQWFPAPDWHVQVL